MTEVKRYFGTDGIRGLVGKPPVTPDFVLRLGWAAGRVLKRGGRHRVLVGKDTRISGYMFESALEAGLSAAGVDILLVGPMPTPAIAYLTRTLRCDAGIVISASHNPHHDNGIKFFSAEGRKLSDEIERAIEAELDRPISTVESAELGKAQRVVDAPGRYIEFCKSTVPARLSLKGMKLVVDCANGATYHVAPSVFRELGAKVVAIGAEPDGLNINAGCGSTDPGLLSRTVVEQGADAGIAFDGDGDRVILVDRNGVVLDGDEILFIIACARQRNGELEGDVVGTVMSNLGFELALKARGIGLQRAAVGDRYVLELLEAGEGNLGGESSGHIICRDRLTTGDGIIAALQVLAEVVASGTPLEELRGGMSKFPQRMINVRVAERRDPTSLEAVQEAIRTAEAELGSRGRVLLRPSGTEPLIRVMVEGEVRQEVDLLAERLASVVQKAMDV